MRFDGNGYDFMLGVVIARTAKAILVHSDFMDTPVWLPNSQCMYRGEDLGHTFSTASGLEMVPDDMGRLRVEVKLPQWLITKNGYQ